MKHSDLLPEENLMSTKKIAEYFDFSTWTIERWVKEGCPARIMPNGHLRFKLSKVNAWIDANQKAKRNK